MSIELCHSADDLAIKLHINARVKKLLHERFEHSGLFSLYTLLCYIIIFIVYCYHTLVNYLTVW